MSDNQENGFSPSESGGTEEVKEAPRRKPEFAAPAPKAEKPAAPVIAPKPTKEENEAPVASRAKAIANRLPGVINPQAKVNADVSTATAERGRASVNKFLAARAKRNG